MTVRRLAVAAFTVAGGDPLGKPCSSAATCASANGVDGVCCDTACAGQCERCDVAGSVGTCSPSPSGTMPLAPRAPCVSGCTGGGMGDCTTGSCNGVDRVVCRGPAPYGAATDCMGAMAVACIAHRTSGRLGCDGAGGTTKIPTACGSFICVVGAAGYSNECSTFATCGNYGPGLACEEQEKTQLGDCAPDEFCDGGCRCAKHLPLGGNCVGELPGGKVWFSHRCASGNCVDGVCCSTTSCPAGFTCNSPERPGVCDRGFLGGACATATDCRSGNCVDSVCCDRPCNGQCETCGADGVCKPVVGAPVAHRPACTTDGIATCTGTCDGVHGDACSYPDAAKACLKSCGGEGHVGVCNAGICSACDTPKSGACALDAHPPAETMPSWLLATIATVALVGRRRAERRVVGRRR